jgi:hypothetical protein
VVSVSDSLFEDRQGPAGFAQLMYRPEAQLAAEAFGKSLRLLLAGGFYAG